MTDATLTMIEDGRNGLAVICPRECTSPKTVHCLGWAWAGRARCWHCGRFMPMDEAIGWDDD